MRCAPTGNWRRGLALLLVALAACGGTASATVSVRVEGREVVLEGDRGLRGIQLELELDAALGFTGVVAGADAERMNLVRARADESGTRARVLLSDTRRVKLPVRGTVLRIEGTGEGSVRIVSALGADESGQPVEIEVR